MIRHISARSLSAAIAMCGYLMFGLPAAHAHESHITAAWIACESQTLNASCSFSDGHGDLYRGSCQTFNDKLMCVRNQPIVRVDVEHSHAEIAAETMQSQDTTKNNTRSK